MSLPRRAKNAATRLAHRLGYDVVPYDPSGGSLGRHLQVVLARLGINCVLDVGANEGWYGRLLGELGFTGHVVSFEPVETTFEALSRSSSGNPSWTVHRLALGSRDGEATINVARRADFSSLLPTSAYGRSEFAGMSEPVRQEKVRIARLDTIFADVVRHVSSPRVLLKMDTQGADLDVLEGARGCLDRIAAVQSEVYFRPVYDGVPTFPASLAALREAGFELTGLYPVGRTPLLHVIDADGVFVRVDPG